MLKITRRRALALLGAGTACVFGLLPRSPAAAAGRVVTVGTLVGPDKPETRVWHYIRDIIEKELPGRFQFRIVPNAALGRGEKELAEGIRLGSIQASVNTSSAFSGWAPRTQILDLPFLFKNREHLQRVLEVELGEELKNSLAAEGFVALGYVGYGARCLLAKELVLAPETLAGKRVRSIPNPVHTAMWRSFRAQPVTLPIAETYNALKTGVVEAMDLNKSAYAALKLYEVAPYLMETGHIQAGGIIYAAEKFWLALPAGEKAVFAAAAAQGAARFNELILEDERKAEEEVLGAGGHIVHLPDISPWERDARGVWELFAPGLGGLERIKAIHDA
ncbi:MAG: TRAP transporter substrate-binding protein [Deltaproteobacteria bacterium]|nr:TRAP transporter substrate-binding protein [Deltaproteobacteria bacterium]